MRSPCQKTLSGIDCGVTFSSVKHNTTVTKAASAASPLLPSNMSCLNIARICAGLQNRVLERTAAISGTLHPHSPLTRHFALRLRQLNLISRSPLRDLTFEPFPKSVKVNKKGKTITFATKQLDKQHLHQSYAQSDFLLLDQSQFQLEGKNYLALGSPQIVQVLEAAFQQNFSPEVIDNCFFDKLSSFLAPHRSLFSELMVYTRMRQAKPKRVGLFGINIFTNMVVTLRGVQMQSLDQALRKIQVMSLLQNACLFQSMAQTGCPQCSQQKAVIPRYLPIQFLHADALFVRERMAFKAQRILWLLQLYKNQSPLVMLNSAEMPFILEEIAKIEKPTLKSQEKLAGTDAMEGPEMEKGCKVQAIYGERGGDEKDQHYVQTYNNVVQQFLSIQKSLGQSLTEALLSQDKCGACLFVRSNVEAGSGSGRAHFQQQVRPLLFEQQKWTKTKPKLKI